MEEKNYHVNKLFLIGNGFDLALGLKTSYKDFLFWLLIKYIKKALKSGIEIAPDAYSESFSMGGERIHKKIRQVKGYENNYLFDVVISTFFNDNRLQTEIKSLSKLLDCIKNKEIEIHIKSENILFKKIFEILFVNWVDIEIEYFRILSNYSKSFKERNGDWEKKAILDNVNSLNKELEVIANELKEYLLEINNNLNINWDISEKHISIFEKEYNPKFLEVNHIQYYFLNFNYTNSLANLLERKSRIKYKINYIHGSAYDENNLIFGYGDEVDIAYRDMELFNENCFFKHIKSFSYFKYPNYRELLSYLSSGKFRVCIYGHSCGLSDRVMLKEIFEHENCESIRVYYLDENEYFEKTMNISRHFNSNQLMRQRIINFDNSDIIPQA